MPGSSGTATARAPRDGYSTSCSAWVIGVEYRPAFLKEQEREEKTVLLDKQVQPEQKQRLPHFKHWLGKCNPYLANLWRFRKRRAPGIEVRHREFARVGTQASPYMAYRKMVKKRFPEKWMTHGWMRSLLCTCAVPDTQCRK